MATDAERIRELEEALEGIFVLIDSGELVRSIKHDGDPDWAERMVSFVGKLQKASFALHRDSLPTSGG